MDDYSDKKLTKIDHVMFMVYGLLTMSPLLLLLMVMILFPDQLAIIMLVIMAVGAVSLLTLMLLAVVWHAGRDTRSWWERQFSRIKK